MSRLSSRTFVPEAMAFGAFLLAYVALFVGVPPLTLCLLGSCLLEPRPEAFLLAASLAFGLGAVIGVATGGLTAILIYEALEPMGLTLFDGAVAFSAFLVACGAARWLYLRRLDLTGALAGTWALTAFVTLIIGSYSVFAKEAPLPDAYTALLGQALLPINVAGVPFLFWAKGFASRQVEGG